MAHNSKDKPHKHISNILTEAENIFNVNLSFSYKARLLLVCNPAT